LLIADGDAELCDLYEMSLWEYGYEVETASDGLDCLRKLRQTMPAVLVLDLEIHWGGGDGVLAYLREESFAPETPVILTSTSLYPYDFTDDLERPVVAYLPKPFAVTALLTIVRSIIKVDKTFEPSELNGLCPSRTLLGLVGRN
jgi:DNA-binding NtrC family response regulator